MFYVKNTQVFIIVIFYFFCSCVCRSSTNLSHKFKNKSINKKNTLKQDFRD